MLSEIRTIDKTLLLEGGTYGETAKSQGEILLYENGGEKEFVSVVFQDETFWLTQSGMAELFDCSTDNISCI